MPVTKNYSSKAHFIQTCMDKGWVAPGDVLALSAAYDFVSEPGNFDPTAADSFLEKAAGTDMWTTQARAELLGEMKSVFAPLAKEPELSALDLSAFIVDRVVNQELSQFDLDGLQVQQLMSEDKRQAENDYHQAEEALNLDQIIFSEYAPRENSGSNGPKEEEKDNNFNLFGEGGAFENGGIMQEDQPKDAQPESGEENLQSEVPNNQQSEVPNNQQGEIPNEQPGQASEGNDSFNLFDQEENQNRINEAPEENPNRINEVSEEKNVIDVDELLRQMPEPQRVDLSLKTNEWEYLDLEKTKIPGYIRNASDPEVVAGFVKEHEKELSDLEALYLDYKLDSLVKIREKAEDVNRSLAKGEYNRVQAEAVIDDELGTYVLQEVNQPSFQTAKNGCWSCFYQMALESRGVKGLTQEDIRAYRPTLAAGEDFEHDADYEMNSDIKANAIDMGDLTLELLPDTMMRSIEIDSYHRYKEGKDENADAKAAYSQNVVRYVKEQIIDSVKNHKSPVGLMMDGHYITIIGIDGNDVLYKNSQPTAEAKGDPNHTYRMDLGNLIDKPLNGENATGITLTRLEDIKLSKEGNILYNMPGVNASVQPDGTVIHGMRQDQMFFMDERHKLGAVVGRTGEVDVEDKDADFRRSLRGDGFFRVEKVYLPKKVNMELLQKEAQNRTDEEEQRLKDDLASRQAKQQEIDNAIKEFRANPEHNEIVEDGNAPAAQLAEDRGFKIPFSHTGKPFFGNSRTYYDFKMLLVPAGWQLPKFEKMIQSLSNLYDLHPFEEGTDQMDAANALFIKHFANFDQPHPGTVSELRKNLTEFLNVIENGGNLIDETGKNVTFRGRSSLNVLTKGQQLSIEYLKGMVGVLTEIETVLPTLNATAVNIDSFIDEKGNVRTEEIHDNPVIKGATEARRRELNTLFDRNVFGTLRKAPVGVNREILIMADPNYWPEPGYADLGGPKLNRAANTNEFAYTGFYNSLLMKGFPFAHVPEEQNLLNAVFNLNSLGGEQFANVYDRMIGQKDKVTARDMNQLLFAFNDMLNMTDNLPDSLRESAKCIGDTLGATERDKFRDLEIAYDRHDAAKFAQEYRKWMRYEQSSLRTRGYTGHFDPRVEKALATLTNEMNNTKQGEERYEFYQQVKAELDRLEKQLNPKAQQPEPPKEEEKKEEPQKEEEKKEEPQKEADDDFSIIKDDESEKKEGAAQEPPKEEEKKEEPLNKEEKKEAPQQQEEDNDFSIIKDDEPEKKEELPKNVGEEKKEELPKNVGEEKKEELPKNVVEEKKEEKPERKVEGKKEEPQKEREQKKNRPEPVTEISYIKLEKKILPGGKAKVQDAKGNALVINEKLVSDLRYFKKRTVSAEGWKNSNFYQVFQRSVDDLINKADEIVKNRGKAGFDEGAAKKQYLDLVETLKTSARDYKDYRWENKTPNPAGEPGKEKLNNKDRGKLMLMDEVLLGKHYMFNPEKPSARPEKERNAFLIINENTAKFASVTSEDLGQLVARHLGHTNQQVYLGEFRDAVVTLQNTALGIMEKRFNDGFTNEKANAAYSECVRDAYKCAENYKKSVLGKNYRDTDYADKGLSRAQIEALTEADKFLSGDSPLSAPEKQWATIKNRYVKSEVQPAKENNIIK